MSISQKCQYALRALLELAKRSGQGPVTVGQIAQVQAIPPRFLELILGQLRRGGYVRSRRGVRGGYVLAVAAEELSVGEIIRRIDGPVGPVRCVNEEGRPDCPLEGNCALMGMWLRARDAVAEVYDSTTFQDLVHAEPAAASGPDYCI